MFCCFVVFFLIDMCIPYPGTLMSHSPTPKFELLEFSIPLVPACTPTMDVLSVISLFRWDDEQCIVIVLTVR